MNMQSTDPIQPGWDDLRLFLAVAETGSFSAAARQLKLGQPTLSRRIADLEEQLGSALFIRQNQGCVLTALGESLLPGAQQMAQWAQQMAVTLSQTPQLAQGKVRIATTPSIAFVVIPQVMKQLSLRHSEIEIEVLSGTELLSLARGEADISLRTSSGKTESNELLCLATIASEMLIYAHPDYVKTLSDQPKLEELRWISWPENFDHLSLNQILKQKIPNFRPAFSSDDFNVQMSACAAGIGAMVLPKALHFHPLLNALVPINIDISAYGAGELNLVVHKRQAYLPKVQIVINAIKECFKEIEAGF
jgi:DNA-binding transcriptional LysR family regulator